MTPAEDTGVRPTRRKREVTTRVSRGFVKELLQMTSTKKEEGGLFLPVQWTNVNLYYYKYEENVCLFVHLFLGHFETDLDDL